jgi:hypothetical protein
MFWRAVREEDLNACLDVDRQHAGYELVGRERTFEAWKQLIRCRSFQSAVVEADPAIAGHRIVGFGASVFVTRAFADNELSNPSPGLNARIIASIASGGPVALTEAQLRSGNTNGSLDLVVLFPQWRKGILTPRQIEEVQAALAASFLDGHRGYRLNRIFVEVVNEVERVSYLERTGIWRVISEFREFYLRHPETKWNRDRCLAIITRDEAFQVPGHIAAMLFQFQEPRLGLLAADQRLLEAAQAGLTDEELARQLGIGLASVKKRWRSIFERVSARPDLFPGIADGPDDASRGRQKRHHILAYVREHPEELRPFLANYRGGGA